MRVIALGFFDGVHLGHQALLREAACQADRLGAVPSAISFDIHPSALVSHQSAGLLTLPSERESLMRDLGIQELLLLHFDEALMHMRWDRFVMDLLADRYEAAHLVCGEDFRFGDRGEGNAEKLSALCRELGIGLSVIPPVCVAGQVVSSTRIRCLLQNGQMSEAVALLGHPYRLEGTVLHGKALGHTLGFPTANLDFPEALLPPSFGVYACMATLTDGTRYPAVVNVGVRPTVMDSGRISVEAWLQGYEGNLYGSHLLLEFNRFLRPEQRFESLEALKAQVLADGAQVRSLYR
ncbi:MAG: riboflavin biosynthesis protein RibF [Oscillospiraceae bacterium]|nr:riboflavin biosynthesis protein RibF [Oscillospiraceae bacterium]